MRVFNILFLMFMIYSTTVFVVHVSIAEEMSIKTIRAVKIEPHEAPAIDGKLDDECWKKADKVSDFIQFQPILGEDPRDPTDVYILYDKENLYVGFECFKQNPDQVLGSQMERDSHFFQDDYVEVLLDTYHDHRNCYAFSVNCLGTKVDRRIANEGSMSERGPRGDRSRAWDCAWEASAEKTEKGWTAELAIPFSELRFDRKGDGIWGINFWRANEEFDEENTWADVGDKELAVSRFGNLVGLAPEELVASRPLELKPYVTAKPRISPEWDMEQAVGLDIRYPSTTITADFTINPDFAQVEADPSQINLEDVELRLSEKRPFFQEGMELFQTPIELFYTRRAGIKDLKFGAKAVGKLGNYNIALLDCQADDTVSLFSIDNPDVQSDLDSGNISEELRQEFDENGGIWLSDKAIIVIEEQGSKWLVIDDQIYTIRKEADELNVYDEGNRYEMENNYFVLRAQRDIGASSSIGILGVNKQKTVGYNRLAGMDFNTPLPADMRLTGQYAASWLPDRNDDAFVVNLDRRTRELSFSLMYADIGRDFEAQSGFIPRIDRRGFRVRSGYDYNRDSEILRSVDLGIGYERLENQNGLRTNEERRFEIRTRLSDFFVSVEPEWYYHVNEDDESISYTDKTLGFFGGWFPPRWASLRMRGLIGNQEDKDTFFIGPELSLVPVEKLKLELELGRLNRKKGEFRLNRRLGLTYQFTHKMFFRTTYEVTTEIMREEEWEKVGRRSIFVLYGWEFRPECNFYLVYTDNKDGDEIDRIMFAKISYLLKWNIF